MLEMAINEAGSDRPLSNPDPMANVEQIRQQAAATKWFHTMDIGHGIETQGVYDPRTRLPYLKLPASLSGKHVLDIGAWDGFYSFECERRGAASVLATDSFCWSGGGWGSKAGFDLAHRSLGSKVETREIDVMDMSAEAVGQFDLVLLLGVLYHMRHPLLCLEKVASVTKDLLILETEVDLLSIQRPAMAFYESAEVNQDDTNWFGPNPPCVTAMLRAVGFEDVTVFHRPPSLPYRIVRAAYRRLRYGLRMFRDLERGRVVFHARKARA